MQKRENRAEGIFEETLHENFSKISERYKTTDPGSSENKKQDKYKTHTHIHTHMHTHTSVHTIFKL